jgi:cytochrome P450
MDTVASTMSFLLHALLTHPDILSACYEEVDQLYAEKGDGFGYNDLRKLKIVPSAIHETLRLYPIGVNATRTVTEDFVYKGYRVPAKSFVYLPTIVPHFLDEYYPNAMQFDIDRDMKPPVKGAFAPFALGAHTCLGAGFGQAQLLATTVILLRHVEFELSSPDFQMKITAAPVPNPGTDFKIRLKGFRS